MNGGEWTILKGVVERSFAAISYDYVGRRRSLTPFYIATPVSLSATKTPVFDHSWPAAPSESGKATTAALKPFDLVGSDEKRVWESLRARYDRFRSPFFSVAFSEAVHAVRQDVEVAVVYQNERPIAFLPLHRQGQSCFPVGRFFNDAHNIVCDPGLNIPWHWLLRQIGCNAYHFHALVGQPLDEMPPHCCHRKVRSFRCEIGDNPVQYLRDLGRAHKTIGRQGQKTRKMAREVGTVQFEFDCRDVERLRQAIRWKRNQYQRTHILDLFSTPWTMELVERLFGNIDRDQTPRGILSTLNAGGRTVAAHFGMLDGDLLHYWFPAYDPAFARYSPGTGLFVSILEAAEAQGLRCIDMGYGEQPYKRKQTDETDEVGQGCISPSFTYRLLRCGQAHLIDGVKALPLKSSLKRVGRSIWPSAGRSKLT